VDPPPFPLRKRNVLLFADAVYEEKYLYPFFIITTGIIKFLSNNLKKKKICVSR
jgi:hypothetical protein